MVDDHQMMRQGLRLLIQSQEDLELVGETSSGQTALELARTHSPTLVLMDIHLPGENGVEVSRKLLAEFPSLKIMILSADSDLELVEQALLAGVSGYVTKESGWEELLRAIRTVLDNRLYLSPEVASSVVNVHLDVLSGRKGGSKPALGNREKELLKLVAEGKRNKEIAIQMGVGVKSVETYRSRLMKKLGCSSPADLTRYAIREGIAKP